MTAPIPDSITVPLGFADLAFRGRNDWWRYLLSLVLVLGGVFLLTFLLSALYALLGLRTALEAALGGADAMASPLRDRMLGFVYLVAGHVLALPLMHLILPWLHARPWVTFLTARPRFDWRLSARSTFVMIVLQAAALAIGAVLAPHSLAATGETHAMALFLPLTLLLFPLQCLAEEVFFRGYLAQLTGRVTANLSMRILIPALIFAAAHVTNPESRYDPLWAGANYLLLALYLGAVSLKGRGLEVSFGGHLGSNLFAGIVLGSSVSVSPSPTLFTAGAPDFKMSFVTTGVLLLFHYGIVFGLPRHLLGRKGD